jgi:hypothetical protein
VTMPNGATAPWRVAMMPRHTGAATT